MFRICLLLFVLSCDGKTVRYTNIPPSSSRTTRTYQIEVPGKPPIRIIEAEPIWNDNNLPRFPYRESLEHRAVRIPTEAPTPETVTLSPSNLEENSTKIYSPEALNEFLKNYAEKIREKKRPIENSNEQIDRLSDISIEEDGDETSEKSKRWGLVNVQKHNHPYEDKHGWVTMEAVPWSSSKISKWHTNQKYEEKPNDYRPYDNYPSFSHHSNDYNTFNEHNKYSSYDISVRPPRPKPVYGYESTPIQIKPRPDYDSRPSNWERPGSSYNIHLSNRPDWADKKPYSQINLSFDGYPVDDHRDIITDGKPGDFPNRNFQNRRPYEPLNERPSSSLHPSSHPSNGNGEWVLLSTTKGYQYPKPKTQRSLEIVPNSVGTKRSVRLTVLPPEPKSKVNMTTSHGGLLEVESTFETVEQSQRKINERLQANKTTRPIIKIKKQRPHKSAVKSASNPVPVNVPVPVPAQASRAQQHDPSTVLAAIGAGMVPATMAMLMPFVNGRRRRSIDRYNLHNIVNVTRVPFIDYELTLQRSY